MMIAEHRAILNTLRLYLVRNLRISESFLACLRHDYTLTEEMQQEIMGRLTNGDKVGKFLDIIVKRGPTAFEQLIQALVITDQDEIATELDEELALEYIKKRNDERRIETSDIRQPRPSAAFSQPMTNNAMPSMSGDQLQYLISLQQQSLIQQQQMMPQTQMLQSLFLQQLQQQIQPSGTNQQQFQPPGIGQFIQQRNFNPVTAHQVSQDGSCASMSSNSSTASGQPLNQPQEESSQDICVSRVRTNNAPVQCSEESQNNISVVSPDGNMTSGNDLNEIIYEIKKIDKHPRMDLPMLPCNLANVDQQLHRDNIYPVRGAIRGRALIISNTQFVKTQFRTRAGSDYDEANLEALFQKLQFDVSVEKDKNKEEILNLLEKERSNEFHSRADMFVLFILSHGSQGSIYASDGEEIEIDKMIAYFDGKNCPGLKDKPKIFFIQACQGRAMTTGGRNETDGLYETDVEVEEPRDEVSSQYIDPSVIHKMNKMSVLDQDNYVPGLNSGSDLVHEKADMLVAYATVKGYRAWRRTDLGSWFVRCVVYVFSTRACSEHLADLLTGVNHIMSHMKVEDPGKPQYKQIAEKKDTLRKKVFFFPGYKGPCR